MAPHSSTFAWKIPWTEEPGRLQTMGSQRVGHNWTTSLWLFTFMHWRRKWQPTPVFLPGESQGQGSLVGHRLWGRTESDQLKRLSSSSSQPFLLQGQCLQKLWLWRIPTWLSHCSAPLVTMWTMPPGVVWSFCTFYLHTFSTVFMEEIDDQIATE